MKVTDIIVEDVAIDEAEMHSGIMQVMKSQGYKFLGHGQDQDAYLAPDGTILKIFGYNARVGRNGFTEAQNGFVTFATYCQQNPSNPFLPDFGGWEKFNFKGKQYLQIKCERLFDLKGEWEDVGDELENLTGYIENRGVKTGLNAFLDHRFDNEDANKLILLMGKEGLELFVKTLADIIKIGNAKGFGIDLHGGNFMLGSDGTLVINDPYFTGSFRGDSWDE